MKNLLVTGGTGFLGRRLGLRFKDSFNVTLAGRNNKQNLQAQERTGCRVLPMDVTSIESVRDVFIEAKPHIVIHAAATKFVDLSEKLPMECVDVNVLGSQNVARVAVDRAAEMVIGISTDKAAPPIRNTYGLSKGLMERMYCSMDSKTSTRFACVRYGNVAWSTGSVLPIWKKMFEDTKVIRSTGWGMRRFFFTVDDAVQLIATAVQNIDSIHGMVLSRTMKAAQIKDLLDTWVTAKGGRWEPMEGRPGEREDEFLIGDLELIYTKEAVLDDVKHFIISFNQRVANPISVGLSSANAERLTQAEMLSLINHPED
jgi:UDP-N-acetylglucosamine 4,6-dehydratase